MPISCVSGREKLGVLIWQAENINKEIAKVIMERCNNSGFKIFFSYFLLSRVH